MLRVIYASPHQGMLSFLNQQPHLQIICFLEQREHLYPACEQFQPDVLLVSEELPGETSSPLVPQLIQLKQTFPTLRIIYLAGSQFLTHPQAKRYLKQLHQHQLYYTHLQADVSADDLLRYFETTLDISHLEQQSGISLQSTPWKPSIPIRSWNSSDFMTLLPTIKLRTFSKVSLPSFPKVSPPSFSLGKLPVIESFRSFSLKKYGPSAALLLVAVGCFYLSVQPLIQARTGVDGAMSEWETLKESQSEALIPSERPVLEDSEALFEQQKEEHSTSSNDSSQPPASNKPSDASSLLGLIKLSPKGKAIGIRFGTDDSVLAKGAGLDELGVGLGEKGNSILYGHREEVFWDLKNIQVGDVLTVETLDGTLHYQVTKTRVTYPQDTSIYDKSSTAKLTLVTCHPFIYMGPTPERFVVEADLIPSS